MRRVALKIAYIGTDFHGYQRQPNYRTVEGEIIKALKECELIEDTWTAHYSVAGRTDKGVHSTGNVISFITDGDVYINKINGLLPDDIKIIGEARVPYGFKVRFPEYRTYTYVQPINSFDNIDLERIEKTIPLFIGEHNFRNFSKKNEKNPNREIYDMSFKKEGNVLIFTVVGKSFLWNMVRKMITAILKIARGEFEISVIDELFKPVEQRQYIRLTPAPAKGLILSDMQYRNIKFKEYDYAKEKLVKVLYKQCLSYEHYIQADNVLIKLLDGD